ncbi:Rieske (2Fe-2S) protein [Zunongwangia sp. HRR-M8]|uniref:Rieske (2Fe-2S) protein n=1 Tax=Zunongwangia sp. HRR-M8 TaxID=3015170 RepID=UPI0022DD261F|nr:hypothetical protein [Zunongwangia sp. HRR-M8]WBL22680.1 hypothetical protein PBT89_01675 [Zunongwangia sp. HRR-M8]
MKGFLFFNLLLVLLTGCSSSDDNLNNNPNLVNINFGFNINLDLPQYNQLNFPGNQIAIYNEGIGIKGVVIYNINNDLFLAYELSDPNHAPNDCSAMEMNGIEATCSCEGNVYNIISGEQVKGNGEYAMKPYRVEKRGNTITISN